MGKQKKSTRKYNKSKRQWSGKWAQKREPGELVLSVLEELEARDATVDNLVRAIGETTHGSVRGVLERLRLAGQVRKSNTIPFSYGLTKGGEKRLEYLR